MSVLTCAGAVAWQPSLRRTLESATKNDLLLPKASDPSGLVCGVMRNMLLLYF